MSNGADEKKRKIILDAEVAEVAARGITETQRGKLTHSQVAALIKIDEGYLAEVRQVAPTLCENIRE
jgi:hypothetical protein